MKRNVPTFSRYPFGVAAEVHSLDFIERGTEFWDAKGAIPAGLKVTTTARYGKRRTNGRETTATR